jgi:hypothetical protein
VASGTNGAPSERWNIIGPRSGRFFFVFQRCFF